MFGTVRLSSFAGAAARTWRPVTLSGSPFIRNQCTAVQASPVVPLHPMEALRVDTPSGWAPPLGPVSGDLPFKIFRTENSQLPVYHRRRKHNTQFLTVLRKYRGDTEAIHASLREELGPDAKIKVYQGRMEVLGDHRDAVRAWVRRLGF